MQYHNIIYKKNLAPKTYFYESIDNKNEICDKNKATTKGKGILKKYLNYNMYNNHCPVR